MGPTLKALRCGPVAHTDHPSGLRHAFGLGVRFHTRFNDGTALVTAAFVPELMPQAPGRLCKPGGGISIDMGWDRHRETIAEMERDGRQSDHHLSFENFVETGCLEDQLASEAAARSKLSSRTLPDQAVSGTSTARGR